MTRRGYEHTIEKPCEVSGRGYWSGQEVTVRFLPAPKGTGITLIRVDLPGKPSVPALVEYRQSMSLRTVLKGTSGAQVSMVEHLMAALCGLEIDNCVVEVDADEMPGLDGSAAAFTSAIANAGRVQQSARSELAIDRVIRVGSAASWIEASPSDTGQLVVEYQLDYGSQCPIVPQSAACSVNHETFAKELARARTFVTAEQAAQLRSQGVAQHVTDQDLLVFDNQGVVNNQLHFDNECARHKALDMVGDLALIGVPLVGRFVSYRGGHELNAAMAHKLRELANRLQLGVHRNVA